MKSAKEQERNPRSPNPLLQCKTPLRNTFSDVIISIDSAHTWINDYLMSIGLPIDIDHLILEGRISKSLSARIIGRSLQKLGEVYCGLTEGRISKIGLIVEPSQTFVLKDLASFVRELSVCKIRLFLRHKKYLSVVAIVVPVVEISNAEKCKRFSQKGCFLREFSTRKELKNEVRCLDCIRTSLSTELATWFLRSFRGLLKEDNVNLIIDSANWFAMEKTYRSLSSWLDKCFIDGENY